MPRERVRTGHRLVKFCAVLGSALLILGGCSTIEEVTEELPLIGKSVPPPPCPQIKVLADASNITQFRPGPGRDITDILLEAEITAFSGACEYEGDDGLWERVKVELESIRFDVTRGPASRVRSAKLRYFVKIPHFYPSPIGAAEFDFRVAFPENRNSIEVSDSGIEVDIPLRRGARGADFIIYLGFVLNEEQIERNRQRRGPRAAGGG
jgi:hypothetical protein